MQRKPSDRFSKKKTFKKKAGKPGFRGRKPRTGVAFFKKRACKFCAEKIEAVDYKDTPRLTKFITERGKIMPSRLTGMCATHQRMLARAIKRSRHIALLPYTARY